MQNRLEVSELYKYYGRLEAVKGISFSIASGEIFALLGPNGAGKSTTLRIISTILTPSAGKVTVCGHALLENPEKIRSMISYLPEDSGAYRNLTGEYYLRFMAGLYAETPEKQEEYVKTATEINELGPRLKDKIRTYSKGMTRKLLISRALMTKPGLAVLDEPTSGLDVLSSVEVRKIIREFARSGVSILLSSHNMLEIEYLSDRVAIMHKGLIRDMGTPAELKEKYHCSNLEEVFAEIAS